MRSVIIALFVACFAPCMVAGSTTWHATSFTVAYCRARGLTSITLLRPRPAIQQFSDVPPREFLAAVREFSLWGMRFALTEEPTRYTGGALHILEYTPGSATRAYNLLSKVGFGGGFRAGRQWLLMVASVHAPALLRILAKLPIFLDSEFVLAVDHNQTIEIQEIYFVGRRGVQTTHTLGQWTSSTGTLTLEGLHTFKIKRRGNWVGIKINAAAVGVNKIYFQSRPRYGLSPPGSVEITGGYSGNIFILLQKLLNFSSYDFYRADVQLLEGYAYGLYSAANDSWSGLVGMLQRGEADVSACEVSPTEQRHRHLDFSQPIQIIGRRLYYRRPDKVFHPDAFVKPFALNTWLALVASLPLLALAAVALGSFSPDYDPTVRSFGDLFFGLVAAVMMQGWPALPRDLSRRVLMWGALTSYMVLGVSYSAKMVALRTTERPQLPIESLQDVLEYPDWNLGFVSGALERNYFQAAEETSVMGRLWRKWVLRDPQNLVSDAKSGLERALDSRFVFVGFYWACQETLRTEFTPDQACQVQVVGEDLFKGGVAFGFSKYSPYAETFNYWLLVLRETGILTRLQLQSMPTPPVCSPPLFTSIALTDVAPALMLLAAGALTSLVILIFELILHRYLFRPAHDTPQNRFPVV